MSFANLRSLLNSQEEELLVLLLASEMKTVEESGSFQNLLPLKPANICLESAFSIFSCHLNAKHRKPLVFLEAVLHLLYKF